MSTQTPLQGHDDVEGVAHLLLPLLRAVGREELLVAALDVPEVTLDQRRRVADAALDVTPTDTTWLRRAVQWAAEAGESIKRAAVAPIAINARTIMSLPHRVRGTFCAVRRGTSS